MQDESNEESEGAGLVTQADGTTDRWTMARDVAVLQVKLIVDGFRDLMLVPASLIAGAVSLFAGEGDKPAPYFYRLLAFGKQSERWIDLFGALRNSPEPQNDEGLLANMSIDDLVARVETFVVAEYKRGGVTAQAKQRIDEALDAIQKSAQNRS